MRETCEATALWVSMEISHETLEQREGPEKGAEHYPSYSEPALQMVWFCFW